MQSLAQMATDNTFNIADQLDQALLNTNDVFKWVHPELELK